MTTPSEPIVSEIDTAPNTHENRAQNLSSAASEGSEGVSRVPLREGGNNIRSIDARNTLMVLNIMT
jgi:hypothetical protein